MAWKNPTKAYFAHDPHTHHQTHFLCEYLDESLQKTPLDSTSTNQYKDPNPDEHDWIVAKALATWVSATAQPVLKKLLDDDGQSLFPKQNS